MFAIYITALVMGAMGSLHCIGMCGPLALSLPVTRLTPSGKMFATLLYNLGRTTTYAVLGALFGLLGLTFGLVGLQQSLSIAIGIIILIVLVWPKNKIVLNSNSRMQLFFSRVRNKLGQLLKNEKYQSVYLIGLLNGLLPCGLLYMALAAGVATASVSKSILFMIFFGLGTLPLMWAFSFFGSFINLKSRQQLRKLVPVMFFFMACLLILRGLGLGIPFVSPAIQDNKAAAMECVVKP
jgi:hypothetical protein